MKPNLKTLCFMQWQHFLLLLPQGSRLATWSNFIPGQSLLGSQGKAGATGLGSVPGWAQLPAPSLLLLPHHLPSWLPTGAVVDAVLPMGI